MSISRYQKWFQVAIPVINDGVKARRKIKGGGRILICLANDLLNTQSLAHTQLSVMKNGHWGCWGGNYECFVVLYPSVLCDEQCCNLLLILMHLSLFLKGVIYYYFFFISTGKPCLTSCPVFCNWRDGGFAWMLVCRNYPEYFNWYSCRITVCLALWSPIWFQDVVLPDRCEAHLSCYMHSEKGA